MESTTSEVVSVLPKYTAVHIPANFIHLRTDLFQQIVLLGKGLKLVKNLLVALIHGAVFSCTERNLALDSGGPFINPVLNLNNNISGGDS